MKFLSRLRTSVLKFACNQGLEECVNKARNLYAEWMQNPLENKYTNTFHQHVNHFVLDFAQGYEFP